MTQEPLRVTIGDVAERAGVSIATVSRVVNLAMASPEHPRSGAGRDRQRRYESGLVARSLPSQRTGVIDVLVADIGPFSAETRSSMPGFGSRADPLPRKEP
jgi:LacI family transcriptional regulator